ncbi:MAG TPA: hypothetical protein VMV20_04235 [Chitinophagaceae bacterium]|nr:hypothetical protein [Chitinophagaceae bacterium]
MSHDTKLRTHITINQDGVGLTNTRLTNDEIIDNYRELWKIEKTFRVAKNGLKIRPIYQRLPRRIEAHFCIALVAD